MSSTGYNLSSTGYIEVARGHPQDIAHILWMTSYIPSGCPFGAYPVDDTPYCGEQLWVTPLYPVGDIAYPVEYSCG